MYLRNLLDYLKEAAKRVPEKIAFCDEKKSYSYGEMLRLSERIGTAVVSMTEKANQPVFVLIDRTAISVLGILSVLQAGCYYVPIDCKTPGERLERMLGQMRPSLLLFAMENEELIVQYREKVTCLAIELAMRTEADDSLLASRQEKVLDIDPAYGIFTSGSTGTPKGILISHRSVIDFTEWMAETCGVTENDVLANQAPFCFDLSVKDLYQTLRSGATLHILPRRVFMFPLLLVRYLNEHRVTTLIWATSAFRLIAASGVFAKEVPTTVRKVILGGETLYANHLNIWRQAMPKCCFINLYGPTEITVDCTWFPIEQEYADGEVIPIGKACRNMEVILLDENLSPAAQGEIGEIYVRGAGLALGYFGDNEKTAAAFVQDPRCPGYPMRLYRTGDLGRMDAEGNILFVARKDDQIKHMGYRIELGEIETALNAIGSVEAAVCFFDAEKDMIICAYQGNSTETELSNILSKRLPRYMMPGVFRRYVALPQNINGKTDRAKLHKEYEDEKN